MSLNLSSSLLQLSVEEQIITFWNSFICSLSTSCISDCVLDTVDTVVTQIGKSSALVGLRASGGAAETGQQVHTHSRVSEGYDACCEASKQVRGEWAVCLHRLLGAESPESGFLEEKKETFPNPQHIRARLPPGIYQLGHLFFRHICKVCFLVSYVSCHFLTIRQHFATI